MECKVCYRPYGGADGKLPFVLTCGHSFCHRCMMNTAPRCAVCRADFKTNWTLYGIRPVRNYDLMEEIEKRPRCPGCLEPQEPSAMGETRCVICRDPTTNAWEKIKLLGFEPFDLHDIPEVDAEGEAVLAAIVSAFVRAGGGDTVVSVVENLHDEIGKRRVPAAMAQRLCQLLPHRPNFDYAWCVVNYLWWRCLDPINYAPLKDADGNPIKEHHSGRQYFGVHRAKSSPIEYVRELGDRRIFCVRNGAGPFAKGDDGTLGLFMPLHLLR
jgi:hypothetical protein